MGLYAVITWYKVHFHLRTFNPQFSACNQGQPYVNSEIDSIAIMISNCIVFMLNCEMYSVSHATSKVQKLKVRIEIHSMMEIGKQQSISRPKCYLSLNYQNFKVDLSVYCITVSCN